MPFLTSHCHNLQKDSSRYNDVALSFRKRGQGEVAGYLRRTIYQDFSISIFTLPFNLSQLLLQLWNMSLLEQVPSPTTNRINALPLRRLDADYPNWLLSIWISSYHINLTRVSACNLPHNIRSSKKCTRKLHFNCSTHFFQTTVCLKRTNFLNSLHSHWLLWLQLCNPQFCYRCVWKLLSRWENEILLTVWEATLQRSWLRNYATSRKVAGSKPDKSSEFYLILPTAFVI
jgi:hypothetical protein